MSRTADFLDLYNRLDSLCRERFELDDKSESAIMRYINELHHSPRSKEQDLADELDAMRQLRNMLVHTEKIEGEELAEVNPTLLRLLKEVIDDLENPPRISTAMIPLSKLCRAHEEDKVLPLLGTMLKEGFSHIPVLDSNSRVQGVFSEGVIVAYLFAHPSFAITSETTLALFQKELPLKAHQNERYLFLSRGSLLSDAEREFALSKQTTGKRLGMVFVSEHGSEKEALLGAVVGSSLWEK